MTPFDPALHAKPRTLIEYIQADDPAAIEYFALEVARRLGGLLVKRVRHDDWQDLMQDVFIAAIERIRAGALDDPEALWHYVAAIERHLVARWMRGQIQARSKVIPIDAAQEYAPDPDRAHRKDNVIPIDRGRTPERAAMEEQKRAQLRASIGQLKPLDREILERFYLNGESHAEIEAALELTATQFRLRKSRALDRLELIVRQRQRRPLRPIEPAGMAA